MSFGKGSNTTTQTTGPNAAAMGAYQNLLTQAGNVANTPYQSYNGEFVAPVNQQQQTGIGGINANAGFAQPYIQQAAGYANQAATPISGSDIARYQSPYTQQVVDATTRQFNNQNAQQQQQVLGNAAAQGALGGDRVGVAQANLAGQQQVAEAPVIAGLYNQGYGQASQMALAQQQNLGQAAYSLGNLGVAGQNAALTGAGAQLGAGGLEQQTQQAQDAARFQEFMRQQAYPFQTTQWLAGLDTGVGSQMGGTSTTTAPPPNPWNTALGLGTAALSFFNKGGRIRGFDQGGGIGDAPYGGVSGYVPGVKITGGSGAPKPPTTPGQQAPGLGSYAQAGAGLKNLWNKYGPSNGPLDLTGGGFSPDGIGSLQGIGSAPEAGFGMGPIYRDGGIVNLPQHDRIELRRGFDDGGAVAQAGFGTGSIMPDSFDDRFYIPARTDPRAYNLLQDSAAAGPDYDSSGNAAPHMADIPLPRPRPGVGADQDAPDLPAMITRGSNTAGFGAADDLGPDVMAFDGHGAPAAPQGPSEGASGPPQRQSGFGGLGLLNLSPNVRQGLLAAGLGMMASHSPFLGQAIGEGGLKGLGAYSAAQKQDETTKKTEADIEHGRKQLEQAATNAADNLKLRTQQMAQTERLHNTPTPYQTAQLEEQKRQHDMSLKTPVKIGEERNGTPIMALPRLKGSGELEYYRINRDGSISDSPLSAPNTPPSPTLTPGPAGPTSALPSSPANAAQPTRTAKLDTGDIVTDAPPPEVRAALPPASAGARDDQFLQQIAKDDPGYAKLLKSIADYQTSPAQFSLRNNRRERAMGDLMRYDPTYDQRRFNQTNRAITGWAQSQEGRATRSLSTVIEHLGTAEELGQALQNGDIRGVNQFKNWAKTQFGYEGPVNFEFAKQIVADEIAKAVIGGTNGEADRRGLQEQISRASSPEQLTGVVRTAKQLMAGQVLGLQHTYETATGLHNFDNWLTPRAKAEIDRAAATHAAPAGGGTAAPAGGARVGSKAEYDALQSGATYTNAKDGKTYRKP